MLKFVAFILVAMTLTVTLTEARTVVTLNCRTECFYSAKSCMQGCFDGRTVPMDCVEECMRGLAGCQAWCENALPGTGIAKEDLMEDDTITDTEPDMVTDTVTDTVHEDRW